MEGAANAKLQQKNFCTMSTLRERLKSLRGSVSQADFARKIGATQSSLGRYERGESIPDAEFIQALYTTLGVEPRWFVSGEGPTYDPSRTKVEDFSCDSPCDEPLSKIVVDVDLVQVPKVRARLSAGSGSFEVNGEVERYYAFRSDWLRRKGNVSSMVMMTVSGESMQPLIMDGDTILIDQSQVEPLPGRLYAVGVEGLVYVKRIETRPGQLILKSENQEYEPIIVDTQEDMSAVARILGRMLWLCRDVK